MPRTLWKLQQTEPEVWAWSPADPAKLQLTPVAAQLRADIALEFDGMHLAHLYRQAKIIQEKPLERATLDCREWKRIRHKHVIVLWGDSAAAFWDRCPDYMSSRQESAKQDRAPCLCNCLSFALWATCEHEQVVRCLRQELNLQTPGQQSNPGGRGKTNAQFFNDAFVGAVSTSVPCAPTPPAPADAHIILDDAEPGSVWDKQERAILLPGLYNQPKSDSSAVRPSHHSAPNNKASASPQGTMVEPALPH